MTTPRDAWLFAVDHVRANTGPSVLDLRPTSVSIITRTWDMGQRGAGTARDGALPLPNWTKVRHITTREIMDSGGVFEDGDVRVGPVTPAYNYQGSVGGFTPAQLNPPIPTNATQIIYRLASQSGSSGIVGDYTILDLERDKTLHFILNLRREKTTPL
jgi:hypothetical protein